MGPSGTRTDGRKRKLTGRTGNLVSETTWDETGIGSSSGVFSCVGVLARNLETPLSHPLHIPQALLLVGSHILPRLVFSNMAQVLCGGRPEPVLSQ